MKWIYIVGGLWILGALLVWLWIYSAATLRKRFENHPDYSE